MLDYRYAELSKSGPRWYISFYAINPATGKLQRKRIYLNRIRNQVTKLKYANKMVESINKRLDLGWNPFIAEKDSKQYTRILDALKFVLDFKLSYLRKRSKPNYISHTRKFTDWLKSKKLDNLYIYEFSEKLAIEFFNYLLLEERIRGRTYNNYLIDFRSLFNLLQRHKFITENPFKAVTKLPEVDKMKQPFTIEQQKIYADFVKYHDPDFYIISMYCYYCAIRPNEIVQLKIKHIQVNNKTIVVPPDISKNKRQRNIPVAAHFWNDLEQVISGIDPEYYICSKGFKPGRTKIQSVRISEHFREIAKKIGLPDDVFFYSLKDTVADRLIDAGFSIKLIRDLFGHSDIATTDKYMRKINARALDELRNNFPDF
jgi:integrase/recombinase XerD